MTDDKEMKTKMELLTLLKKQNALQNEGLVLLKELYTARKTLNYFLENGMLNKELTRVIYLFHKYQVEEDFKEKLKNETNKSP